MALSGGDVIGKIARLAVARGYAVIKSFICGIGKSLENVAVPAELVDKKGLMEYIYL